MSVVRGMYAEILVDQVHGVTGGLEREGVYRLELCGMYVFFIDLERQCDRVDGKALWQVLRVCDVGGKLLGGVKSMYIDGLACVRVD